MIDENKLIKELKDKYDIENECSFNEYNVQEKLQENSFNVMKYYDKYIQIKQLIDKEEIELNDMKGKLFHHYKFDYHEELSTKEIEVYYIPQDEKYKEKLLRIKKLYVIMDFFEKCYKQLEKNQWNMKTFCDNLRLGSV